MSVKIVLIVIGVILAVMGIAVLAAAMHPDWEAKKYEKIFHKNSAPANLKKTSQIIGGIHVALGAGLIIWGLMIHTGMTKLKSK